jgi:hypothetical protein
LFHPLQRLRRSFAGFPPGAQSQSIDRQYPAIQRGDSRAARCGIVRPWNVLILLSIGCSVPTAKLWAQFEEVFDGAPELPAINYEGKPVNDAVSALNRKIRFGELQLKADPVHGYLPSILEALHIPVQSQIVVFSKTSVQQHLIGPSNPRVLYFNDSVVVGWVPGGFIEVASHDPKQGVIFYTLNPGLDSPQHLLTMSGQPVLRRETSCLQCHLSYSTLGVVGMTIRSVFPSRDGAPIRQLGDFVSDHRSPFEERWGGWYVTGRHGPVRQLGNAIADPAKSVPMGENPLLPSLAGKIETAHYLTPYSDIVALTVFDHQMRMTNLLTRAGWEARYAASEPSMNRSSAVRAVVKELVDYLLFIDEAPLSGDIEGSSGFAEKFTALGPWDSEGRSLRQFDLHKRLLRYPCSYMIYSQAFDEFPPALKNAVFNRLSEVLPGEESSARYARLSRPDRQAIIEILRETKQDLPESFSLLIAK